MGKKKMRDERLREKNTKNMMTSRDEELRIGKENGSVEDALFIRFRFSFP